MVFEKQGWHLLGLAVLLAGIVAVASESLLTGRFLGIPTRSWFIFSLAVPICHQVYVWLIWRTELHRNSISRRFGARGFGYYAIGFSLLFAFRLISIILLAAANRGTLALPPAIALPVAGVFLGLAAYLFYSVQKYFGFERAYGIDHFDEDYRGKPFVKKGIFRFTDNGMYVFGFLILWVPGLLLLSKAALVVALFNHLYIWVHYYCTELPDIRRIYGKPANGASAT